MDTSKIPTDDYDAKHGKPGNVPDAKSTTTPEAFGENLNPVRETPPAFTNLRDA